MSSLHSDECQNSVYYLLILIQIIPLHISMLKYFQIQLCLQFIKNALLKIGLIVISRFFFFYKYLPGLAVSNISEIYFCQNFSHIFKCNFKAYQSIFVRLHKNANTMQYCSDELITETLSQKNDEGKKKEIILK